MAEPQTPTTLVDWLDDLSVRFLLNLPKSELSSVPRLCFQVEEAQWFYEDFVRPAVAASGAQPLPSLPLRQFCLMLFQHCPLLSGYNDAQHIAAYEEFLAYKVRVPVRGAILLDESMENVVLVRGWKKGSSWSFPRGKINKDEKDLDCAVREVYEETGYDVRQAGLMPDQEKDAKYIDIVMREQHMRLFVFRGVPEDTHFEPKTRKEISKIQWYSIKDLPGFKKQKHSQAGDAGNANKFYMVAPFLGQLKKWINLQRKKDASQPKHTRVTSDGLGIQTATEDEGETEEATEATPEPAPLPDKRSEDLKRLLSIGGGNAVPAQPPAPQQENQKNDLLAMLRGGAQPGNGNRPPQTPFEQVATVPKEPETPQPDHLRQPMIPPQQQPPHYPLSPPRMQQEQQRNYSLPTPQIFGPGPHAGGFPPPQHQNGFPGMVPSHIQQQFQQRQSVPNMPFGHQGNMPFNGPPGRQQMPPPQLPPQQQHPLQPPPPQQAPNAYTVQGPQGAIASGPAAPNPSQLPAPRLNAHHMNLLNAFKSGNKPAGAPVAPGQPTSRHGSTHQAALLDLFRKPSTSHTPPAEPAPEPAAPVEAVSPTLTDVTEKPPPKKKQERKPTLNEITRTLPTKMKVKSPPPTTRTASPPARPASGQLFDPNAAKSTSASSRQTPQKQQPPVAVLQRPASGQGQQQQQQQTPQPQPQPQPAQGKPSSSPAQDTQPKQKQNGAPPAPFTILARPSSRGLKSPAPVAPPSPLRNQTSQSPASSSPFQPQVLKRPKGGEGDVPPPAAAGREGEMNQQQSVSAAGQGEEQKDHLLALFGKASAGASSSTSVQSPPPAPATAPSPSPTPQSQGQSQANSQRNALLDLLKSPSPSTTSSQQQQKPPTPAAPSPSLEPPLPPNPPSAPRLSPSRNPSSSANPHAQAPSHVQGQSQGGKIHPIRQPVQPPTNHHQPQHSSSHSRGGGGQQQNLLLDIFSRPSSSASGAGGAHKRTATPELRSPGTPISPFALGTPAQTGFGERVARGGSIASASSGEGGRRGSAIGGTPTDASAREFLMGFLNGVARGERQGQGQGQGQGQK